MATDISHVVDEAGGTRSVADAGLAPTPSVAGSGASLRDVLLHHSIFAAYALAYSIFIGIYYEVETLDRLIKISFSIFGLVNLSLTVFLGFHLYRCIFYIHPESPTRYILSELKSLISDRGRYTVPVCFLIISIFIESYRVAKVKIGAVQGFDWDQTFHELDRLVHFGHMPWEWLQPLLGFPPVTFVISVNYNMWLLLMWAVWLSFALPRGERPNRTRYMISFMLVWSIAGSLLATVFASAGPCYYQSVVPGVSPYAPLMDYLHAVDATYPVWALDVQDRLWAGYKGGLTSFGISAMPSLHNAVALLMVLATWNTKSWAWRVLVAHAVLVFLGSIHLAWHYAIDAYLAWMVALVVWTISAPIAAWWDRRPFSMRYQAAHRRYGRQSSLIASAT